MHIVHTNGLRILLDCGLFQGHRAEAAERNRTFPFDPASIDAVILSHAHIDHSGNLPGLVRAGFAGTVYCTSATRDLCAIMLVDSGHIQEKDAEYLNKKLKKQHAPPVVPLYTSADALRAMDHFSGVPYDKEFAVGQNVTSAFTDAGHILGSASVRVTVREGGSTTSLVFTGDVGRVNMPIIRDPAFTGDADALICESTYGGIEHDPPSDMAKQLADVVRRTAGRGGKIIVPAFSVGRTQDLVYALHTLRDSGDLPEIPVYIDSPLAINATDIFRRHPECFDEETRRHMLAHHDPLGLSRLQYVRSAEESKKLNDRREPCIIVAASGMCEAGRILHHLANSIGDPANTVLIVGFQAEHTLGKKLVDKLDEVRIFGEIYKRKAEVAVLNSFSAHADGRELVAHAGRFDRKRLRRIFLVHGEYERQQRLQADLLKDGHRDILIPERGQKFEL